MDKAREHLAADMNTARKRLRKSWNQVAEDAGMTPTNLLRIRKGEINISEDAAYGIEQALRWPEGDIEARLASYRGSISTPETEPVETTIESELDAVDLEIDRRLFQIRRHYGNDAMLRAAERVASISDAEFQRLSQADSGGIA